MADYGLKLWDASGNLTLDLTDTITRLRYSIEVADGVSDSIVLSDIDGKSTAQFGLPLEADKMPHGVSRSGTTISWTARQGGPSGPASSDTLVLVFLYD